MKFKTEYKGTICKHWEVLKCGCVLTGQGWLEYECKYHKSTCKKKSLKNNKYCKDHEWYNIDSNYMSGMDAYGGSDF